MISKADSHIDKIACLSSSGRSITYGELNNLATHIKSFVEPHQLVFCLCSNTIGSIAGYEAFVDNDNATLLLDAHLSTESFDNLMKVYQPRYIWISASCLLLKKSSTFKRPIANKLMEAEGYILYAIDGNNTAVSDNLTVLLATSGSTGSPKLVRLSKENLLSNAHSIIEYLHITDQERPILGLPMNYAYGLSIVNSHLLAGATLLLTEASFAELEFMRFANENGFTSFSGVPYAYETIKRLQIWKQKMPTLRTLTQAGGTLDKELALYFDDLITANGGKLYVMYGQAEATARISYLEPDYIKTKAGSIGKAISGGTLSLIDENGKEIISSDTIGELVYAGPNVSLGYAECAADLMKGDDNHGVIHTGDLAYRDCDGFYYIVGRNNRYIKLYGHRISLDHIEVILYPFLKECTCIGNESSIIVYTTDVDFNKESIIDLLASRTKIPRKAFTVCHIDKIPRSGAGKVLYNKLKP